ncbi:MAG: hypothetical protein WA823_14940 [Candidatus Acidiferrales bacterium]
MNGRTILGRILICVSPGIALITVFASRPGHRLEIAAVGYALWAICALTGVWLTSRSADKT